MIAAFKQIVQPACLEATESIARVVFLETAQQRQIAALHGEVTGPYCQWAKTLPTRFELRQSAHQPHGAAAEVLITDPCYWTPQQPVLYRVDVDVEFKNGCRRTLSLPLGLQRWRADGPHLRRDGERVVLRGAEFVENGADAERHAALAMAREHRMSLIPTWPIYEMYRDASQFGVEVIADLRRPGLDLTWAFREIAWHPAIIAVLVDGTAPDEAPRAMKPRVVSWATSPHDPVPPISMPPWTNAFACQLKARERPAPWFAACDKPVIAIRRGVSYADLHEARAACDRLQADLAPEFNLAGYFVASD